jgi:isopenicillin N synthase-like dioxygenase
MESFLEIPTIDISPLLCKPVSSSSSKASFVITEISQACQNWGFFYILNHSIESNLLEEVEKEGIQFFKLSSQEKESVSRYEVKYFLEICQVF